MTFKILAQNALDAFSDHTTADEYIALVKHVRPDVAYFSEAYDADRSELVTGVAKQFEDLGYEVTYGGYDDTDGRKDLHGMVLLTRRGLEVANKSGSLTQVGARNVAEIWLKDAGSQHQIHFVGVHLNDRSEAKRQAELDHLLDRVVQTGEPTVIAGDLNALHANDGRRLALWPAHFVALLVKLHLFPARDPAQTLHQKKTLAWLGSRSRRLSEIASGKTIARLQAAGFIDADSLHCPTFPSRQPFVQLDHIMLTDGLVVKACSVLPRGSSDHLGIVGEITLV